MYFTLQFVLLTTQVPDKAPSRVLLQSSIINILNALNTKMSPIKSSLKLSQKRIINSQSQLENLEMLNSFTAQQCSLSISKYLLFLENLSKSNKLVHRAFCMDILTAAVAETWFWDDNNGNNGRKMGHNGHSMGDDVGDGESYQEDEGSRAKSLLLMVST